MHLLALYTVRLPAVGLRPYVACWIIIKNHERQLSATMAPVLYCLVASLGASYQMGSVSKRSGIFPCSSKMVKEIDGTDELRSGCWDGREF